MKKKFAHLGWVALLVLSTSTSAFAFGQRGSWIASAGIGLTVSPTTFLISPQLEYVVRHNIFVGPLVQVGIEDDVMFTGSVAARVLIGRHAKVKPTVEGALGIAHVGRVGVHIMLGMGVDYLIDNAIAVGTMLARPPAAAQATVRARRPRSGASRCSPTGTLRCDRRPAIRRRDRTSR
jgi:hypothetical protein